VVAIATFVVITVALTLILGNSFRSERCAGDWTGYAPIGACVTTFWSTAFYVGPAIGLLASVKAALWARRATRP
jgi:hypothetical protein